MEAPLGLTEQQLFQGPIADALTHVGQIAMLRRMFGAPVRGENYLKAESWPAASGRSSRPPGASSTESPHGRGAARGWVHDGSMGRRMNRSTGTIELGLERVRMGDLAVLACPRVRGQGLP